MLAFVQACLSDTLGELGPERMSFVGRQVGFT